MSDAHSFSIKGVNRVVIRQEQVQTLLRDCLISLVWHQAAPLKGSLEGYHGEEVKIKPSSVLHLPFHQFHLTIKISPIKRMDRFPAEIHLAILSYLPQRDLLAASLTCRKFRNLSRSTIFETLCLYGERDDPLRQERIVEFSGLDKAVDELIAWDIAKHVKTVKFCPKYYIDGKAGPLHPRPRRTMLIVNYRHVDEIPRLA